VAYTKVSSEYLDTPLVKVLPSSAAAGESKAVREIVKTLESAKSPIIIVDGGAARSQWQGHVDALIEAFKLPFFVTILGKGLANEESPYYSGAYAGLGSLAHVSKAVEESDLILWLGNYPSDFNT
jgi:pyruvate decarboxylase